MTPRASARRPGIDQHPAAQRLAHQPGVEAMEEVTLQTSNFAANSARSEADSSTSPPIGTTSFTFCFDTRNEFLNAGQPFTTNGSETTSAPRPAATTTASASVAHLDSQNLQGHNRTSSNSISKAPREPPS